MNHPKQDVRNRMVRKAVDPVFLMTSPDVRIVEREAVICLEGLVGPPLDGLKLK